MKNKVTIKEVPSTSLDVREDLVKRLLSVVPEAETDGKIDWQKLKQELTGAIEESNERYDFTWNGKKDSLKLVQKPTTSTLKPNKEKSKNWDTTENIYIEGDNLEVLKILQKSYSNKVKVIYIDPPYNTGSDFVYKDSFTETIQGYLEQTGQLNDEGFKYSANSEMSGRYHTEWLNMMYPRLKLARNLLSEDGVIFISIDDNEVANLRNIADMVFGESCFVTQFLWTKTSTPPSLSNKTRKTVEYVLVYEKNANNSKYFGSFLDNEDVPLLNTGNTINRLTIPVGKLMIGYMENGTITAGQYDRTKVLDDFKVKDGWNSTPVKVEAPFKWTQTKLDEEIENGTYIIAKTNRMSLRFQRVDANAYKTPNNFLNRELNKVVNVLTNEKADAELKCYGMGGYFDYPKPLSLIKYLINMKVFEDKNATILDFFSGSGTTGEAVMELNAKDSGKRKFILVQLPEILNKNHDAYKEGFRSIPEIAQERLKKAGKRLSQEDTLFTNTIDMGFKVFEMDKSNIKKWNTSPENLEEQISIMENNFEEESKPLDIVYEIMLKQGLELSYKIKEENLDEMVIYNIENGAMFIILGETITESITKYLLKEKIDDSIIVFQDEKFKSDNSKLNIIEILSTNEIKYENIFSV